MEEYIFYFLCYPSGDRTRITVIDEFESSRYEKNDYALVNDLEWDNSENAIAYGRTLAEKYNLIYEPFKPRCGNINNEDSYLYL
jgi:hypothetical protein